MQQPFSNRHLFLSSLEWPQAGSSGPNEGKNWAWGTGELQQYLYGPGQTGTLATTPGVTLRTIVKENPPRWAQL